MYFEVNIDDNWNYIFCWLTYYPYSISASEHLLDEKSKLENKLKLLMEEIELVDKHLADQKRKDDEVQSNP